MPILPLRNVLAILADIKCQGFRITALLAITRKLAVAIFHVGRGADFDAATLFDTRKLVVNADDAVPRR